MLVNTPRYPGKITEVSKKSLKTLFLNALAGIPKKHLVSSPARPPLLDVVMMTGVTSAPIGLPAHSRSWRSLSFPAKGFISLMVIAGLATLVYSGIHQSSKNIAEFICYLGIAILASRLKVNPASRARCR